MTRPFIADERGTASVEIVVMLPMFIVLFLAIYYVHGLASARQQAGVSARGCAWAWAMQGCEGKVPLVCKGASLPNQKPDDSQADADDAQTPPAVQSAFDAVADWPLLGNLVSVLFGEGVSVRASRDAQAWVSKDVLQVSAGVYVMCNTRAQSWGQKIQDLLCSMVDKADLKVCQ